MLSSVLGSASLEVERVDFTEISIDTAIVPY
jgi:hypothetical protein